MNEFTCFAPHRGYAVVCFSPVIEAAGVAQLRPPRSQDLNELLHSLPVSDRPRARQWRASAGAKRGGPRHKVGVP